MHNIILYSLVFLCVLVILYGLSYVLTFHPVLEQEEDIICAKDLPVLQAGQRVKILCWNIQYLAGKNYVFWYDAPDGKNSSVKEEDVLKTFDQVINVIQKEKPDIILFQEIHQNAKRTSYIDQEKMLAEKLDDLYGCRSSSYYLKNVFIPHPKIMGSESIKLLTFSKFKMTKAVRHRLPLIKKPWPVSAFNFKRALFEVRLPVKNSGNFAVINTHLDAFAQGSTTMEEQVKRTDELLSQLTNEKLYWLIGGDFNLLAADGLRNNLSEHYKANYNSKTELSLLTQKYNMLPSLEDVTGNEKEKWFTHAPNSYTGGSQPLGMPDRTIDYIFYSNNIKLLKKKILHEGVLKISDHTPVVAEFQVGITE